MNELQEYQAIVKGIAAFAEVCKHHKVCRRCAINHARRDGHTCPMMIFDMEQVKAKIAELKEKYDY